LNRNPVVLHIMLSALATDRARIADIDAKILDLERAISALRIEKAPVQARLDSYKYPVLTLPNEIVSEIFIHFLPNYPLCPPLSGPLSPTLLIQICREWREIALTTPALWRAISISENVAPSIRRLRVADMLRRSGSCPLSIRMDVLDGGDDDEAQETEFLTAVIPHSAHFLCSGSWTCGWKKTMLLPTAILHFTSCLSYARPS